MSSKHDPEDSLRHIVENASRIARYLHRLDQEELDQTDWVQDAVERCIERVCEAVVRLGDDAERLMPGHPWIDIRGMGNRLRHAYDSIDADILWETARVQLPSLASAAATALERFASREEPGLKEKDTQA